MTIHTVAPDESQFVRIIGSFNMPDERRPHVGEVAKVVSQADATESHNQLIFVELGAGPTRLKVFELKDLEYITEKEYFIGCLGG